MEPCSLLIHGGGAGAGAGVDAAATKISLDGMVDWCLGDVPTCRDFQMVEVPDGSY